LQLLAQQVDLSGLREDEAALIVFNALPWALDETISVDIDLWDFFLNRLAVSRWTPSPAPESAPNAPWPETFRRRIHQDWWDGAPFRPSAHFRGLRMRPLGSDEALMVQIEAIDKGHVLRPLVSGPASERATTRVRAAFHGHLPAFGYQVYAVAPVANPNRLPKAAHPSHVLENEHLRVEVAPNGSFQIKDKATGEVYRDLGYFEDGGDIGDGYNYSEPLEDRIETTLGAAPRISRLSSGPALQR